MRSTTEPIAPFSGSVRFFVSFLKRVLGFGLILCESGIGKYSYSQNGKSFQWGRSSNNSKQHVSHVFTWTKEVSYLTCYQVERFERNVFCEKVIVFVLIFGLLLVVSKQIRVTQWSDRTFCHAAVAVVQVVQIMPLQWWRVVGHFQRDH